MPTPDFVLELRSFIGQRPLPLVGVTAVVVHNGRVLLGRRSDNGALTPITGIVDPGEEPADAAVREALEEAAVQIRVTRLAWVHQTPRVVHVNGDQSDFLDLTFECQWLSGEPFPADGEMTEVGWYPLPVPDEVPERMRRRVEMTLQPGPTRFEGG